MSSLPEYTRFIDKHVGETAFVCGAGLSFYEVMHSKNFDKIFDQVVVSVNSSFIAMPWSKGSRDKRFWISNDALVRRWSYWPDVKQAKANKIVRDSWSKYFDEIPDFYQFSPRPTSEGKVNAEDKGLCYCSSVPSAVDLCLQMGCKAIFLLGVDQYFDGLGRSHFWQKLDIEKQPIRTDSRMAGFGEQNYAFKYNNLAFPALKEFASLCNASIYNCSMDSEVKVFEKVEFEQIF